MYVCMYVYIYNINIYHGPFGSCETHCMLWCTRRSQGSDPESSAIVRKGAGCM